MMNRYMARKHMLSVITIDAYGTRVPDFCPDTFILQVNGRNRGSTKQPEVLTT